MFLEKNTKMEETNKYINNIISIIKLRSIKEITKKEKSEQESDITKAIIEMNKKQEIEEEYKKQEWSTVNNNRQ